MATATSFSASQWRIQSYNEQQYEVWPKEGKHILAQYDDESIIVYQAYCQDIADYAVKHQKFGGPQFSYARMSWIKTNFLWMMYRSGWASKKNQEKVLAVRISRKGFEEILSKALTARLERENGVEKPDVRLQWDPDHDPFGACQLRRAIQLGLRHDVLRKYGSEWVMEITDVTQFVHEQYQHVKNQELAKLMVAEERVYPVHNPQVAAQIGVDSTT